MPKKTFDQRWDDFERRIERDHKFVHGFAGLVLVGLLLGAVIGAGYALVYAVAWAFATAHAHFGVPGVLSMLAAVPVAVVLGCIGTAIKVWRETA